MYENIKYWRSLYEDFSDANGETYKGIGKSYLYAYNAFMNNRDNVHKCYKCPKEEERHYNNTASKHPCGQEKCWVSIYSNNNA